MKNNTFPIMLALISILLGVLSLPNPDLRIYGLIIFSGSFLGAIIWFVYNIINDKFILVEKNRFIIKKLQDNLDVHRNILKLEKRISDLEETKNER